MAPLTAMRTPRLPLVLDELRGRIHLETDTGFAGGDKVAVIAQYSPTARITTSLYTFLRQLTSHGYRCVVVSACEDEATFSWPASVPDGVAVLRKPNVGYDFGSWAVGLDFFDEVRRAPYVLLTNDSLIGPFTDIGHVLADFEACGADVWGATESRQYFPHLQSFFVGYLRGILDDTPLRRFWDHIAVEPDKSDIIMKYEVGLGRVLTADGYSTTPMIRADDIGVGMLNPTIYGWEALLAKGFPFVKRELARRPEIAPRGWHVGEVIEDRYGVRFADWLD